MPAATSKRHTIDDIDKLIENAHAHRQTMRAAGKIDDFGHPVQPAPPPTAPKEPHKHKSYCMKCNKMGDSLTEKIDPKPNGTHHVSGKCATCGTKTHTFASKVDGEKMMGDFATTGGLA